jgi:hypothetical protein
MGKLNHGLLKKSFRSQTSFLSQFSDLSLHHQNVNEGALYWIREESLTRVKQVEILT